MGLLAVATRLGVPPDRLLVIGDRPGKDVAVAAAVGARAIRIRQGEYAGTLDVPVPWAVAGTFPEAAALALRALGAPPDRVNPLQEPRRPADDVLTAPAPSLPRGSVR